MTLDPREVSVQLLPDSGQTIVLVCHLPSRRFATGVDPDPQVAEQRALETLAKMIDGMASTADRRNPHHFFMLEFCPGDGGKHYVEAYEGQRYEQPAGAMLYRGQ